MTCISVALYIVYTTTDRIFRVLCERSLYSASALGDVECFIAAAFSLAVTTSTRQIVTTSASYADQAGRKTRMASQRSSGRELSTYAWAGAILSDTPVAQVCLAVCSTTKSCAGFRRNFSGRNRAAVGSVIGEDDWWWLVRNIRNRELSRLVFR